MKFIILIALVFSIKANALCHAHWVNGENREICDNSYDVRSMEVAVPTVNLPEVRPIRDMEIPPIGTSNCSYQFVDGRYQNICN